MDARRAAAHIDGDTAAAKSRSAMLHENGRSTFDAVSSTGSNAWTTGPLRAADTAMNSVAIAQTSNAVLTAVAHHWARVRCPIGRHANAEATPHIASTAIPGKRFPSLRHKPP